MNSGEGKETNLISKYFSQRQKRPHKSSSSESDTSLQISSPTKTITKPAEKKTKQEQDMALQETIDALNKKIDCLATKADIESIKGEIKELTDSFMKKIEMLEGRVFEMECRADTLQKENKFLSQKYDKLTEQIKAQTFQIQEQTKAMNDLQQYSRRMNLRVYKIPEENKEDCSKKIANIITEKMGVSVTESDIDVAHRSGIKGDKPRPILVRFKTRSKRDEVFQNKSRLKNKGVAVGEDLTKANYDLLNNAYKHSATLSTWSNNGKIWAKLINGKTLQINLGVDMDAVFGREIIGTNVTREI